jgi:hypothetical protein
MARTGVTERQVAQAADELLLRGERPTIERVRAELGTGSPNTLIRHLDAWWTELGCRLAKKQQQVAVPEAPESVSDAASVLWRIALENAAQHVRADLEQQRQALDHERTDVEVKRSAAAEFVRDAEQRVAKAEADRLLAIQRSDELARARENLEAIVSTLTATIENERVVAADHRFRLQEAVEALDVARRQAISDRDEAQRHIQAVENRSHQEVDRARLESAATSKRVVSLEKELLRVRTQAAASADALMARVRKAESELAGLKEKSSRAAIGAKTRVQTRTKTKLRTS